MPLYTISFHALEFGNLCIKKKFVNIFLFQEDRSGEQTKDLFPTGMNQEPRVTLLQDGRFALDKDTQTTFLSPKGELNLKVDHVTRLEKVLGRSN